MSEFTIIHTILGPVIYGGVWDWLESEKDRASDGEGWGEVEWRIEALTGAFKKHKTNYRAAYSSRALSRGNKFDYLMYVPLRAFLFICFISSATAAWFSVFFLLSAKFNSTELRVLASVLSVMSCSVV